MIGWGLVACGLGLLIAAGLMVRYAKLPPWTHRDLLAFVALVGTIGGAIILTLLKWLQTERFNEQSDRLITELVRERPSQLNDAVGGALSTIIDAVTWDLKLTSVGIIVVLLSLGLVISARTLKGKFLGNEFEMGTDEHVAAATAALETARAANEKANQIAGTPASPQPAPAPAPAAEPIDAAPSSRRP
jgi:hypothetical protein